MVSATHSAGMLTDRVCVCSIMVLKKLGDELTHEFQSVVHFLGHEQGMQVVVEPQEHDKLVRQQHFHIQARRHTVRNVASMIGQMHNTCHQIHPIKVDLLVITQYLGY